MEEQDEIMKAKLTGRGRVSCTLGHRRFYGITLAPVRSTIKSALNGKEDACMALLNVHGKNKQTMPKCTKQMDLLQEIFFSDMDPTSDHVYRGKIIHLTIMEDSLFGCSSSIHTVVRDGKGDFLRCSFCDSEDDQETRRHLSFGSRISIMNPYFRIALDGGMGLRVDSKKSIIYLQDGVDEEKCRFCGKINPPHTCSRCKRAKYCNRECQTSDWSVLKHKLICDEELKNLI